MAKAAQGFRGFRPTIVSLAVASCFASSAALANPTGAQVVNGQVQMLQNGNLLQITNSPNSIINWQNFSIASGEITRFVQQSAASAVLNRVAAGNPSQILGMLQSNGRVFLVNPSGITFGAGSVVDVAGLVATSLNLSNSDFLAGKLKFTDGANAGSIVNQGNITASGGEVYLVGNAVTNNGIIKSPNGQVVLAAGNSVELVNPGTPNLRVEITAPDNQAVNLGQIVVDSGRAGIYAGLVTNSGTIRANSVVAEGGRIMLKATKSVTLESSSILDASGNGGGRIDVLAKNGGTVNVAGRLDASASVSGDGGFVETSADKVKIADGTVITTTAAHGKTGMWLVDPTDFRVDALAYGGDITGAQLGTMLDSTNITKTSDNGSSGAYGGIIVNEPVSWTSANSLTLIARGNVDVNQPISNTGGGGLNIYAGWDGADLVSPTVNNFGSGYIWLPAPLLMTQSSSKVVLVAAGEITQHGGSFGSGEQIVANELVALSAGGRVILNDSGNSVNKLAGGAKGEFSFNNSRALTVGSINTGNPNIGNNGAISGIAVKADGGEGGQSASVTLQAANGITVNNSITATGGDGSSFSGGNASISLTAIGGDIVLNGATVNATGGTAQYRDRGGIATVSLYANSAPAYGGQIKLTSSSVTAKGGDGAEGGNANINFNAGSGGILVDNGSSLMAAGGHGGNSGFSSARGGNAFVSLSTSGNITVNGALTANGGAGGNTSFTNQADGGEGRASLSGSSVVVGGSIVVTGGAGGTASSSEGSANANGGMASVDLTATNTISVTGSVSATGGAGGNASGPGGTFAEGGAAFVSLNSNSGGAIDAGGITVRGGNGGAASTSNSGGWASATVSTTGPITITGSGINVTGGNGGTGGGSGYGGSAFIGVGGGGFTVLACEVECGPPSSASSVTINGNLIATGGNATGIGSGGSAGVMVGAGNIAVNNATVLATGGAGTSYGGPASVMFQSAGGISATGATIEAYGSTNSAALVGLIANGGDIAISGGEVEAQVGAAPTGMAMVGMMASGNITVGGNISAGGAAGSSSGIQMTAGNAIIGAGGVLSTLPGQTVVLSAANGIGGGAPILLDGNVSSVIANNSSSGDIFLASPSSFTIGSGSGSGFWNLSNAPGGNYIVIGNDVTLGSGAPTNGGMFITANNNAIVGSAYSSSGVLGLSATNINVNANVSVGDLALLALNDVNINGVTAQGNTATVIAGRLNVTGTSTPALLAGVEDTTIVAGEVNVTGGTSDGAFAEIKAGPGSFFLSTIASAGATTGNVNLKGGSGNGAYARIFGDPDVGTTALPIQVGGVIHMDQGAGSGAFARIESASVNSIHVDFTNVGSGGFFINGAEGALSSGDSGFFAGGQPAILGENFFATYGVPGALPSAVVVAVNQVIASTNQQTNLINTNTTTASEDGGGDGVVSGDPKDEKKKALPICGK